MRLFECSCNERPTLFFENVRCEHCGRLAGFCPERLTMQAFVLDPDASESIWRDDDGRAYRLCANRTHHDCCNWMVPLEVEGASDPVPVAVTPPAGNSDSSTANQDTREADSSNPPSAPLLDGEPLCVACALNEVIPDLSVPANLPLWRRLEAAKRRCLFTLMELELPLDAADNAPMRYQFLADLPNEAPVMTGHADGLITINLAEADLIERTRTQVQLDEPYRTLLGHFRHECGHYYWDVFKLELPEFIEGFRRVFGDEREDYAAALDRHYQRSPSDTRELSHVSDYATMHPWEDWAESWAHYLHILDALEIQQSLSYRTTTISRDVRAVTLPFFIGPDGRPRTTGAGDDHADFEAIFPLWIQASVVLNSLNRSMGLADPYPFVLHPAIKDKLAFIHRTVLAYQNRRTEVPDLRAEDPL